MLSFNSIAIINYSVYTSFIRIPQTPRVAPLPWMEAHSLIFSACWFFRVFMSTCSFGVLSFPIFVISVDIEFKAWLLGCAMHPILSRWVTVESSPHLYPNRHIDTQYHWLTNFMHLPDFPFQPPSINNAFNCLWFWTSYDFKVKGFLMPLDWLKKYWYWKLRVFHLFISTKFMYRRHVSRYACTGL